MPSQLAWFEPPVADTDRAQRCNPVVDFSTEDIEAAVRRVGDLGGEADPVQDIPGVGRITACRDDQGTRFSLYEPAREA